MTKRNRLRPSGKNILFRGNGNNFPSLHDHTYTYSRYGVAFCLVYFIYRNVYFHNYFSNVRCQLEKVLCPVSTFSGAFFPCSMRGLVDQRNSMTEIVMDSFLSKLDCSCT